MSLALFPKGRACFQRNVSTDLIEQREQFITDFYLVSMAQVGKFSKKDFVYNNSSKAKDSGRKIRSFVILYKSYKENGERQAQ